MGLAILFFTPKQVFGPRTAKSQPIGIKFCTHLLLYRIHLWANLDRNRCVSRTTRTTMFFVILVMYPKSYIKTTDRHDFGGKPSKWRWGWVLSWKISEFCSVGRARSTKNSIFRIFNFLRYPLTVLRTAYRKQLYLKPMVPGLATFTHMRF